MEKFYIGICFKTFKVQDELKDFLKKNINTTYEGKIDTKEEFSLGLDYAQVYVSTCIYIFFLPVI
jgi:hypothetical protein